MTRTRRASAGVLWLLVPCLCSSARTASGTDKPTTLEVTWKLDTSGRGVASFVIAQVAVVEHYEVVICGTTSSPRFEAIRGASSLTGICINHLDGHIVSAHGRGTGESGREEEPTYEYDPPEKSSTGAPQPGGILPTDDPKVAQIILRHDAGMVVFHGSNAAGEESLGCAGSWPDLLISYAQLRGLSTLDHPWEEAAVSDSAMLQSCIPGKAKITIRAAGKPSLHIVRPQSGSRRVFGLDQEGKLAEDGCIQMEAEAEVSPPELESQVSWEVSPTADATIAVEPQHGRKVKITIKGMPRRNSDFGPRTLTARAGDASDSVKFNVFYRRDGEDHPGQTAQSTYNWFYYWSQTGAAQGHGDVILFDRVCEQRPANETLLSYWNDEIPNRLFVCNLTEVGFTRDALTRPGVTFTGIDTFATLIAHEWEHRRQWIEWWDRGRILPYSECTPAQKADPAGCDRTLDKEHACDCDADRVPDRLEQGLGLDPRRPMTHRPPAGYDTTNFDYVDFHWVAYSVGDSWPIGSADQEDWSCPGKQCPNGF